MPPPHLDPSRVFVTQLFVALSTHTGDDSNAAAGQGVNPLKEAGNEMKKQLLALHVAFPNELLPALDLLDRNLVTRLHIRREREYGAQCAAPQLPRRECSKGIVNGAPGNSISGASGDACSVDNPSALTGIGLTAASEADAPTGVAFASGTVEQAENHANVAIQSASGTASDTIYYVRSAQQRSSRFFTSYDALTFYEIRLDVWNCSCPAFTFSAFPPVNSDPDEHSVHVPSEIQDNDNEWNFGGVSLGEGVPPICKHLLACVLVERCPNLFGTCVEEKVVGVDEAAGWAAGWGD